MKITIDTSQDSHSDIKKAIRLLQSIVGDSHSIYTNASSRNIFDDPSPIVNQAEPAPTSAFASMFDSTSEPETKKEEEKKDIPQIELY